MSDEHHRPPPPSDGITWPRLLLFVQSRSGRWRWSVNNFWGQTSCRSASYYQTHEEATRDAFDTLCWKEYAARIRALETQVAELERALDEKRGVERETSGRTRDVPAGPDPG